MPDLSGAGAVTITAGAILRGKYRLVSSIGKGGMGEVFEAEDRSTGQMVAIKVVRRALGDAQLIARLHREAEAARRIQSQHVPILFEVDHTEDGELFLAMERLHGETLAERLRRDGPGLTWAAARVIGEDVLGGLIDAHAAGVIHRDLKPGNIFVGADGHAKILDFGVCKLDVHDGDSLTSTGEAVGTISYMAPEQIRGASKVDLRADLYAFGMVVFEMLSGRLAHDASGQIAMIASKLERGARNLREVHRVPVPAGLDALLARCLSRKPADRPASAEELLRAWHALGPPVIAAVVTPAAAMPVAPASARYETDAGLSRGSPARGSTRLGLAIAGGALLAATVVLVVALRLSAAPAAEPAGTGERAAASATVTSTATATATTIATATTTATATTGAGTAAAVKSAKPGRPAAPTTTKGRAQIAVEPRY